MTIIEITATIVGIIGGGGGLIAWARYSNELRKQKRDDDTLRWSSKERLREAADGMAKAIWERLGSDLEQAGERLDEARNTVERQQAEIQELLKRISQADHALVEAERKLAVAQVEVDRKEKVISQLQEQIAALEATILELRRQLVECAKATGADD